MDSYTLIPKELFNTKIKKHAKKIIKTIEKLKGGGISINQEISELNTILQDTEFMSHITKSRKLWLKTY